ncbi:MAG: DNA repair protein RecO [Bifidobacteriaceae bacterium]|nr:DNA repair protein RecO [Bifidobacteriaceae bacterium]
MVSYIDQAIVLRNYNFSDYDRIVWLYSEKHGKIHAIAKSARKIESHLAAKLLLFDRVQLELAVGKNLDTIRSARTLENLSQNLVGDYWKFSAAAAILQLTNLFNPDPKVRDTQQFQLLITALRYFSSTMPGSKILDIYARHLLKVHGFGVDSSYDLIAVLEETLERRLDFVRIVLEGRDSSPKLIQERIF